MSRIRLGALCGAAASFAALALASADCATPTEIVVDVRAETVLCDPSKGIKRTGIAVASYDRIDSEPLEIFEGPGCDPPGDRVGTLTITPSRGKDDEVAFRIVAGVDKPADQCTPPWEGCIVAMRRERFTPQRSKTVTIILSAACVGKFCGPDLECNTRGECVDSRDGGVSEASRPDGAPPPDASEQDTGVDGSLPPLCNPTTCSGKCINDGGTCEVTCSGGSSCSNKVVCSGGVDCLVTCDTDSNNCTNVRCATSGKCTFDCETDNGGGPPQQSRGCRNIACAASSCTVKCEGRRDACDGVWLDGGTNTVTCNDGNTDRECDNVHCVTSATGTCARTCSPTQACGPTTSCAPAAACINWQDGGP